MPRPPLADMDYVAAVEAAARALYANDTLWDHPDFGPGHRHDAMKLAAVAVDAVWPILHAAAQGDCDD